MDRVAEWKSHQAEKRITDFHQRLLNEEEAVPFKEDDIQDYTRLIEAMIRDDEDEKAEYYSRLFSSIAKGKFDKIEKLEILKIVKSLTSYDIELVRRKYVTLNYDVKSVVPNIDLINPYSLPRLLDLHIMEETEESLDLSDIGNRFLHLIYSEEELTPEAIGKTVWRNITYYRLSFSDLNEKEHQLHGRVMDALSRILHEYNFKTKGHGLLNSQVEDYPLLYPGRLMVIHDGDIKGKLAEKLSRILSGGCGIAVCVTDDPESDSLAHLKEGGKMIYLTMPKSYESIPEIENKLREFMEFIVEHEKANQGKP